jgi:hypothetical protein
MYQVSVETYNKKGKEMVDHIKITLGDIDSQEYEEGLHHLSDLLFGLDVEYDDIEGDGDVVVDDMLISASEEEPFERTLTGKKHIYKICGKE